MAVLVKNDQRTFKVPSRSLKKNLEKILAELGASEKELSILLVNDRKIKKLNNSFRNVDAPTDVLSFPQIEEPGGFHNSPLLGDVVVSVETAHCQAMEHSLSLEEELILLIIHGTLHLLGYDHERSEEEDLEMRQKTRQLFDLIFPGRKPSGSCAYQ